MAYIVLTYSGGEEELPPLGKPVLVMRQTTEPAEGVEAGTARLVGTDEDRIVAGCSTRLTATRLIPPWLALIIRSVMGAAPGSLER
jgi:UDP-N-acetylglucosamine 2-epimerase